METLKTYRIKMQDSEFGLQAYNEQDLKEQMQIFYGAVEGEYTFEIDSEES
jgi:hypothetical protein